MLCVVASPAVARVNVLPRSKLGQPKTLPLLTMHIHSFIPSFISSFIPSFAHTSMMLDGAREAEREALGRVERSRRSLCGRRLKKVFLPGEILQDVVLDGQGSSNSFAEDMEADLLGLLQVVLKMDATSGALGGSLFTRSLAQGATAAASRQRGWPPRERGLAGLES